MFREGLVSTIIPVFNRAALLREAVDSVLAQTYHSIEIIIVDDESTDDTPELIARLEESFPDIVRSVRIPNGGPGAAREAGRQLTAGEFIQYLDSDDLLCPKKFELQVAGLRADSSCDVSYGQTFYFAKGERPGLVPWKRTGEAITFLFPSLLQSRWWGTSTPLYRRELLDRIGPWSRLRNEEDWEYDCRVAATGTRLHYCPEPVSHEREHRGPRLSRGGGHIPSKLRDRAEARRLILAHAQRAGIGLDVPEMRHFARELFLLCRQCGAAGLSKEARMLFELAREASGPEGHTGLDFAVYRAASSLFGWTLVGRLSRMVDRVRSSQGLL